MRMKNIMTKKKKAVLKLITKNIIRKITMKENKQCKENALQIRKGRKMLHLLFKEAINIEDNNESPNHNFSALKTIFYI